MSLCHAQTVLALALAAAIHCPSTAQESTKPTKGPDEVRQRPAIEYVLDGDLVKRIVTEGTDGSQVMAFQDHLCHEIGSRLTGSRAFDLAADWAVAEFAAMGLDARLEEWGEWKVGWDRGQWMGRVVMPEEMELQVACPGWTGSTRGISQGVLVATPKDDAGLRTLRELAAEDPEIWLFGALPSNRDNPKLRSAIIKMLEPTSTSPSVAATSGFSTARRARTAARSSRSSRTG